MPIHFIFIAMAVHIQTYCFSSRSNFLHVSFKIPQKHLIVQKFGLFIFLFIQIMTTVPA